MKDKVTPLFLFCIICLFSMHKTRDIDFCTMNNNTITINTYKSALSDEERDGYYYWIGLRNNFYYTKEDHQLEKMTKYFEPEKPEYISGLYEFGIPFFVLAGGLLFFILVYLVFRFILKGCMGPKIIENSYVYQTYGILIFGFIVGFVFMIVAFVFACKSK